MRRLRKTLKTGVILACAGAALYGAWCWYVRPPAFIPAPSAECRERSAALEVLSLNGGLAPGLVEHSEARIVPFAQALAAYRETGIICLQEVWKDDAVEAVRRALGTADERFFHSDTRGWHERSGKDVCTHKRLEPLVACVREKCADAPQEHQAICARRRCPLALLKLRALDLPCLNCLVATAARPLDEVVTRCTSRDGASRIYDGANGIIMASKWPLTDRETVDLPSSGANRIALLATVQPPGSEPIEIACTHLTSAQSSTSPTDERFRDWRDEQIEQFRIIDDRLRTRAGKRPMIFVGDFNVGPRLAPETVEEGPRVWKAIMRSGYAVPSIDAHAFACTSCEDNTLRLGQTGKIIDHVLVRDPPGGTTLASGCAHRIMEETHRIIGADGTPIETHLSDHYGIIVKFDLR